MSDLRIGLIAEGKTDQIVIQASLKAILSQSFVLTLLQPETSDALGGAGPLGGGWGGVYGWCRQLMTMQYAVGANPSLIDFDLIIIHVDADIAGKHYSDYGISNGLNNLPCERPCPPPEDSVDALRSVVAGWLNLPSTGGLPVQWVFCTPSKCTEAWVIAALYKSTVPTILNEIECNGGLESWLSQRPVREGKLIRSGKKQTTAYLKIAQRVTDGWGDICSHCSQAIRFGDAVRATLI